MSLFRTKANSSIRTTDRMCASMSMPTASQTGTPFVWRPSRPSTSGSTSPSGSSASAMKWHVILLRLIFVISAVIYIFIPTRFINRISDHPSFASVSHAGRKVFDAFSSNNPDPTSVLNADVGANSISPQHRLARDLCTGSESVAIVAACMNRQETLSKVLPTWLAVEGVSQIVIVDWGSQPPLRATVRPRHDDRLTLIRVRNESNWVLSRAYNLAFGGTRCPYIIRTDCDYALTAELLSHHQLSADDNSFYTGNWENARDENEIHLNGAMVVKKESFERVGGYDERIQTYGWDDEDLYNRLSSANLTKRDVSYDHISHYSHDDSARAQTGVKFAQVQIDVNQLILDKLPQWSQQMKEGNDSSKYSTIRQYDDVANGRYSELEAVHIPAALANRVSAEEYDGVYTLALARRLADDHQIPWDVINAMPSSTREKLLRMLMGLQDELDGLHAKGKSKMTVAGGKEVDLPKRARVLIVHCMHGLGNRLRALGSALAFAKNSRRVAMVIWEEDVHIAAGFHDLFEASDSFVVLNEFGPRWPLDGMHQYDESWNEYDFYNYMEMEENAKKGEMIVNNVDHHLYYKGAYVMEAPDYTWWEVDNTQLKTELKPVALVREHLEKLEKEGLSSAIGVHIRNRTLEQDIKEVDFKSEYGEEASLELERWRGHSCYETFIEEMLRIIKRSNANGSGNKAEVKFYIATDTWQVVEILERRFPKRILSTRRECDDRDTECVKFAVIDLYALSRTKDLLGSNWSSYTEVAERLGGHKARLAGRDFSQSSQRTGGGGGNGDRSGGPSAPSATNRNNNNNMKNMNKKKIVKA